jgi:very-short-patch-repair endonuclease
MLSPTSRIRGTSVFVDTAAKRLRKKSTPAEKHLWQVLKGRQLAGLKFRRQHPVGRFILDFYCADYKLVIEVDGEIHKSQVEYDAARTAQLETHGYKVLRFSNEFAIYHTEELLAAVLDVVRSIDADRDKSASDANTEGE